MSARPSILPMRHANETPVVARGKHGRAEARTDIPKSWRQRAGMISIAFASLLSGCVSYHPTGTPSMVRLTDSGLDAGETVAIVAVSSGELEAVPCLERGLLKAMPRLGVSAPRPLLKRLFPGDDPRIIAQRLAEDPLSAVRAPKKARTGSERYLAVAHLRTEYVTDKNDSAVVAGTMVAALVLGDTRNMYVTYDVTLIDLENERITGSVRGRAFGWIERGIAFVFLILPIPYYNYAPPDGGACAAAAHALAELVSQKKEAKRVANAEE